MMWSGDGAWTGALRVVGGVIAAALLASCGGGEQVERFHAARVIAFGDETSVIEIDHTKYTINSLAAPTTDVPSPTIDCTQFPIWVQVVASGYGVPFPQCPGNATSAPSLIKATANACAVSSSGPACTSAADVGAQVDNFLLSDSFGGKDLVTVLAGENDIWALYNQVVAGTLTQGAAESQAEAAGTALAGVVNRIAQAGGKVLIATMADQSLTPAGRGDAARVASLHQLTARFNSRLRVGLINDGRMIGLVLHDESVNSLANTATFNSTDPACDDAHVDNVRTCTSQTLRVKDGVTASPSTWLWADRRHLSPAGQSNLGSLALTRASNNPF
ncbi:MAG TPA: hypothetical protein VF169_22390 [Albitalea sp.]|uniref:hypothetical protein n=1 Tax=Piscinibacter sp. TaxID=1903157 RepID=UPI002ED39FB7